MISFKSFFLVFTLLAAWALSSLAQDGSPDHPSSSEVTKPEKV